MEDLLRSLWGVWGRILRSCPLYIIVILYSFQVELRNGLREMSAFAERQRLAIVCPWWSLFSRRNKSFLKLKGTNGGKLKAFRRFLLIFADFRFSWELQHFGGADLRRKPKKKTADFRSKPQETTDVRRNLFLSLITPPNRAFKRRSGKPSEGSGSAFSSSSRAAGRGGVPWQTLATLSVAPYRAILRYYRCDTPYRAILSLGGGQCTFSRNGAIPPPPLALSFAQAHLCDATFCYVSCGKCAIPHKNKHERVLRYYRYKYRAIWKVSLLGV